MTINFVGTGRVIIAAFHSILFAIMKIIKNKTKNYLDTWRGERVRKVGEYHANKSTMEIKIVT